MTKSKGGILTMTVEQVAEALGLSRGLTYEAIKTGQIPAVRVGKRLLVPRAALEKMLDVTVTVVE